MWYELKDDTPVKVGDFLAMTPDDLMLILAKLETKESRARVTRININYNEVVLAFDVSTVFLRLEHGFDNGKPILFETMVFCDTKTHPELTIAHLELIQEYRNLQQRYTDIEDARQGHENIVDTLEKRIIKYKIGELETQNIMLSL